MAEFLVTAILGPRQSGKTTLEGAVKWPVFSQEYTHAFQDALPRP